MLTNAAARGTDSQIAHPSQRFSCHVIGRADGGITRLIVEARVMQRMAKGRMEAKDGAKAEEIGAKEAAGTDMLARVAKVGAAKVREKETEALEQRRETRKANVTKGEEGRRA